LLGLTDKQKAEILFINRGHDARRPYKDLLIGLGPIVSHVYRLEVSPEEYWVYTSEQGEKVRLDEYVRRYGGMREGLVREG
jgi:TraG P-loop domain